MPFATVNGIQFNYEIQGSGPRALFIHGIGADLKNPVSIFKTAVPEHFTVLAFDPRGLGESGSTEEPFTMADMADDAAGLAAAVGWETYHVIGASMGGMVAQELALRHPQAVDRLALCVTNGGPANGAPQVIDKMDKMSTLEKLQLSDTRQDAAWAEANPEQLRLVEDQSRLAMESMLANPAARMGFARQVQAVVGHDAFHRLQEIKAPTLVCGGRFDGSNPPQVTRAFADQIPGARYELLEHGHGSWYYDPTAWQLIISFLRGLD